MDAEELMKRLPFLDRMMAETLLIAHEKGFLSKHLESLVETQPANSVIKGAIVVENNRSAE
jgi:hypothetical protein